MEMKEHERRAWSVDFSSADPTLLASGSDDGSVKLWNINQAILFLHLVDVKLSNYYQSGNSIIGLSPLSRMLSGCIVSPFFVATAGKKCWYH